MPRKWTTGLAGLVLTGLAAICPAPSRAAGPEGIDVLLGDLPGADPLAAGPEATGARAALWCSASDPQTRQFYVSGLVRLPSRSNFRLWDYEDRFARAVGGLDRGGACQMAKNLAAATTQRAQAIDSHAAAQWSIVRLGVF
jgi:hypothetical protein